jgi:hypothetical protein
MNFVLQSTVPVRADQRFVQPLWRTTLGWFFACVASVTVAAASLPQVGWAGAIANPAPVASLLPSDSAHGSTGPIVKDPRSSARCQTCGIVEMVRTVHVAGAAPADYELTVRMRDGSRRTTSHSDSAGWRVGDSIMLIGGAKLADLVL